jgi:hypothetical protein
MATSLDARSGRKAEGVPKSNNDASRAQHGLPNHALTTPLTGDQGEGVIFSCNGGT